MRQGRVLLRRYARVLVYPAVERLWGLAFSVAGRLLRFAPAEWTTTGRERVLVLAPHPDDETLGCGGTIALHALAGDTVWIAIATDGGASRAGMRGRVEMAVMRSHEAEEAARALGADRLLQLGLAEGRYRRADMTAQLLDIIDPFQPTIIYTTSCVDYHPEHVKVAQALAEAMEAAEYGHVRVRVYEVQVPLTPVLTNLLANIHPAAGAKRRALAAYETQANSLVWQRRHALYTRKLYRGAGDVEAFWELPGAGFCKLMLHCSRPGAYRFRGLRPRPFADGLAWLAGLRARLRLRAAYERGENVVKSATNADPGATSVRQRL